MTCPFPRRIALFRVPFFLAAGIFLFLSAAASAAEKTYDLKYRPQPGREFSLLNMHISHQNLNTPNGLTKVGSLTRDLELNYRIISSDAAGTVLEAEYRKKLYRNIDREGKLAVTDFAAILGRKIRYTISPAGEPSRFEGFSEMPAVPMPGGWSYTGDHLREEVEHLFPTFPNRPIAKGESWTRSAFGAKIEYTLIDEVKFFGHDCVRIFAKIEDEQSVSKSKDRNGNDVTIETVEPYTDIYYFDLKDGMMLYRFSVASHAQSLVKDAKGAVINDRVFDVLYETFVTFK